MKDQFIDDRAITAKFDNEALQLADRLAITFRTDREGDIVSLSAPLEPMARDIVFVRQCGTFDLAEVQGDRPAGCRASTQAALLRPASRDGSSGRS